jgi:hypothetical protein
MPTKQWPFCYLKEKAKLKQASGEKENPRKCTRVLWKAQNRLCLVLQASARRAVSKWKNVPTHHVYCSCHLPSLFTASHRLSHWGAHVGILELYAVLWWFFVSFNFQSNKPGKALDILPVTGILTAQHTKPIAC